MAIRSLCHQPVLHPLITAPPLTPDTVLPTTISTSLLTVKTKLYTTTY